jgi:hypothetical protein
LRAGARLAGRVKKISGVFVEIATIIGVLLSFTYGRTILASSGFCEEECPTVFAGLVSVCRPKTGILGAPPEGRFLPSRQPEIHSSAGLKILDRHRETGL